MIFVYIILCILITSGIIILKVIDFYDISFIFILVIVIICIVLLSSFLLCQSITYYDYKAKIKEYYILKQMYEESKKDDIRDATIKRDVIQFNMGLASVKYWNSKLIIDDFIPDDYANLEYIK
jgi:uncharacterized membrane protein